MANSKRDALRATLVGQGYTTGSISDRLYAREKAIYIAAHPGDTAPRSIQWYLNQNNSVATRKKILY